MTRIQTPEWAPPSARHVIRESGQHAVAARAAIAPLLPAIFQELDQRVNAFANDPDQCFISSEESFPQQSRLDGFYYIGNMRYEAADDDAGRCRLWIEVRCTEKPRHEWRANHAREGYDYLGLEAIVNVRAHDGTFEFDDGFNTSVI